MIYIITTHDGGVSKLYFLIEIFTYLFTICLQISKII